MFTWYFHPNQFDTAGYMISHTFAIQPGRGIGTIGTMLTLLFLTWMHNDLYMLGIHLEQEEKKPRVHQTEDICIYSFHIPTCATFKTYNKCALWFARLGHLGIIGIVGVSYVHYPAHAIFFILFVLGYLFNMCCTHLMYRNDPTTTDVIRYIQCGCIILHFIGICTVIYICSTKKEKEVVALGAEVLILACIVTFFLSLYKLVNIVQIKMHINLQGNYRTCEDCCCNEISCSNPQNSMNLMNQQNEPNVNTTQMFAYIQRPTRVRRQNVLLKL